MVLIKTFSVPAAMYLIPNLKAFVTKTACVTLKTTCFLEPFHTLWPNFSPQKIDLKSC
uniref:Uncharacterized protein n=1 Tax=Anguilla anguilla TaxID=7936 RepID=A0A0E9WDZ4_ANGAN